MVEEIPGIFCAQERHSGRALLASDVDVEQNTAPDGRRDVSVGRALGNVHEIQSSQALSLKGGSKIGLAILRLLSKAQVVACSGICLGPSVVVRGSIPGVVVEPGVSWEAAPVVAMGGMLVIIVQSCAAVVVVAAVTSSYRRRIRGLLNGLVVLAQKL